MSSYGRAMQVAIVLVVLGAIGALPDVFMIVGLVLAVCTAGLWGIDQSTR